ncbi:hypothetical protein JCM10207_008190 [Rhodosporidiobolus poonsookiae]
MLGLGSLFSRKENKVDIEPVVNLPASYYRSPELYALEQRAIFSKKWLFTTHESRFKEAGDYILYTVAGLNFFVIRDRQGSINAFQNVCRHRAFPVLGSKQEGEELLTTETGKANILACKYHGWSYSMKGELAKAPSFDNVPGFDPKQMGLWRLRLHIDELGFIWVNMDMSEDALEWEDQFGDALKQQRLQAVNFDDYQFDHSWGMEDCQYNWKVLLDNYNECYHCGPAHPFINKTSDLTKYTVITGNNCIQHFNQAKPEFAQDPDVVPNFFFPYSSITITPDYAYTMRVVPKGPTTTAMQYDVYRHVNAKDDAFEETDKIFKQIEHEDKFLCTNVQRNIAAGTWNTGPLNPKHEAGVIYFQKLVKEALVEHWELEKAAGHEIHPARYQSCASTDDAFCSEVSAGCGRSPELQW